MFEKYKFTNGKKLQCYIKNQLIQLTDKIHKRQKNV